jgi:hypothetical protein
LQASLGFQSGQPPDLPGSDQEIVSSLVGFESVGEREGEHQQGFVLQHEQELTQLSKEQVLCLRVFVSSLGPEKPSRSTSSHLY